MYKSRIILSSLTTLGLVGAGYVATNHLNSVSAESSLTPKVETIESKIDNAKNSEVSKSVTVHADEVKPLSVNKELVENAVVESESIEHSADVESKSDEAPLVVEEVLNPVETQPVVDNDSEVNITSNELNSVDEGIKDEVIYDSRNDVESTEDLSIFELEIVNVQDAPQVENVLGETAHEETQPEVQPEAEAPTTETVAEEVPSEDKVEEDAQPVEEVKYEETFGQPASEVETPKFEETSVEEAVAPKALTNPINDKTNTYPIGQCTWGVKSLADWVGNYWGNANEWGASARKAGYTTGTTPQVGSVVVFPNVMYEGINYGHVAYVTHVYDDGSIEVMEANYGGNQSIGNYRGKFNPNDALHGGGVYYIYPNA